MATIQWTERPYTYGVDRGVVYPQNTHGVPWNGLIQVDDKKIDLNTTQLYHDGVAYGVLSEPVRSGIRIEAYSVPEAIKVLTGNAIDGYGIMYDQQELGYFSMSYRTLTESSYEIHFLTNITAVPSNNTYKTHTNRPEPLKYSYEGVCVPHEVGNRLLTKATFPKDKVDPTVMKTVEEYLYGTDAVDANADELLRYLGELNQ